MKILSFDVSSSFGTIAVYEDGKCLAKIENPEKRSHASKLVPLIEATLRKAKIGYPDLDLIVTTKGPGSFTGIRIGLATAKGLAIANNTPLLGYSSFDVYHKLARKHFKDKEIPVIVIVDAMRDDVYVCMYDKNGNTYQTLNILPRELIHYLPTEEFILTGNGVDQVQQILLDHKIVPHIFALSFTANDLCKLAYSTPKLTLEKLLKEDVDPFYLRPPDAKLPT